MKTSYTRCTSPDRVSTRLRAARRVRRRSGSVSLAEIVIVGAIVVLLIVGTSAGAGGSRTHVVAVHTVRVEAGQTLWSIARSNPLPGLTTQQTAELIARTNGLDDVRVAARTSIRIPVSTSQRLVALRE